MFNNFGLSEIDDEGMTIEFQRDLLRYLLHYKREGELFLKDLDRDTFDRAEDRLSLDLIKRYQDRFGSIPSKNSLFEFFDREARATKGMTDEKREQIEEALKEVTDKKPEEHGLVRQTIVEEVQKKLAREVFMEEADNLKTSEDLQRIEKRLSAINKIGREDNEFIQGASSGSLIQTEEDPDFRVPQGNPTSFHTWNAMTKAGGFHAPQLVTIMAGPKAFKTGLMLNLAAGYVKYGLKVLFCDFDNNGQDELKARFYQAITGAETEELEDDRDHLAKARDLFGMAGGDIRIECFMSDAQGAKDVDTRLSESYAEDGWRPDLIIWDYADKMLPDGKEYRNDKRLKTQGTYVDIHRTNNKWGVFSFTPSQVKKEAVEKKRIQQADIAEDFAKIANCQAAFAWCRTEDELKLGYARLIPVAQRQGRRDITMFVKVDEARGIIEETTFEEATDYPFDEEDAEELETEEEYDKLPQPKHG